FREEDIEKEKGVILEEIKMEEDSPDYLVHEIFSANFWKDHALGKPILAYHYARFYTTKKENSRIVTSKSHTPPGPSRLPASSPAAPTPKLISVAGAGRKRKW
ncbi:MAG TPA: hypothetical protein VF311_13240, partial [Terriglobales bacterium]